jgi:hypothetical protein
VKSGLVGFGEEGRKRMGKGSMKNLGMVGRSEFKRINCDEHKGGGKGSHSMKIQRGKGSYYTRIHGCRQWIAPSIESDVIRRQRETKTSTVQHHWKFRLQLYRMPQDADGSKHVESGIKTGCGARLFQFGFLD